MDPNYSSTNTGSNGFGSANGASGSDLKSELKGDALRLKETATQQGELHAEQGKQKITSTAKSASSAIQTAAEELRNKGDAPEWLASSLTSVAKQVETLADSLQDKSPRDLVEQTTQFARQSPTAFLAASAAIGFAAARFLKAGREYQSGGDTDTQSLYGSQGNTENAMYGSSDFDGGIATTGYASPSTEQDAYLRSDYGSATSGTTGDGSAISLGTTTQGGSQ